MPFLGMSAPLWIRRAAYPDWPRLRLLKSAIARSETLGGNGRCTTKVRCREPRRHQEPDVCASPAATGGADVPFFGMSALLWIRRGAYIRTKSVLTYAPPACGRLARRRASHFSTGVTSTAMLGPKLGAWSLRSRLGAAASSKTATGSVLLSCATVYSGQRRRECLETDPLLNS